MPVLAVAAAVMLGGCDDSTAPIVQDYESLPADNIFLDADYKITSGAVRRAHMLADTAYMFQDSAITHLRVVYLEMFDNDGNLTSTLTADEGEFDRVTQKTVARGNVVLVMPDPDGRTVWTEELHYDPTAKRVWSDVPVRILQTSGEDVHGEGFTADDQFNNFTITGGAGTGLLLPGPDRAPGPGVVR
jgi:LPS export ABC transporter protein LptC